MTNSSHKNRVLREAEQLLKASGLPWRIESRKRHDLAFLNDMLVGTISRTHSTRHDCKMIEASIRRVIRQHESR